MMNRYFFSLCLAVAAVSAMGQTKKPAVKPAVSKPAAKPVAATAFKNNYDSVSYALGVRIFQNLQQDGLSEKINYTILQKAITDASAHKKPALDDAAIMQCLTKLQMEMTAAKQADVSKETLAKSAANKKIAQDFLANNGKRAGVVTLPDGLQYEVLKAGTDARKPTLNSMVKCHYHGTLLDGTVFDSSVDRGEPASFPLARVIRGWQEALQLMNVGSKWKLYIPSDLAYGDNPPGGTIQPGALLVFEVELLDITN